MERSSGTGGGILRPARGFEQPRLLGARSESRSHNGPTAEPQGRRHEIAGVGDQSAIQRPNRSAHVVR